MAETAPRERPSDLGSVRRVEGRAAAFRPDPRLDRRRPRVVRGRRWVRAKVGAAGARDGGIRRGPLDRREGDQAETLADGRLAKVCGTAIPGRAEHGDAVRRRILERVAQVLERLEAPERVL